MFKFATNSLTSTPVVMWYDKEERKGVINQETIFALSFLFSPSIFGDAYCILYDTMVIV